MMSFSGGRACRLMRSWFAPSERRDVYARGAAGYIYSPSPRLFGHEPRRLHRPRLARFPILPGNDISQRLLAADELPYSRRIAALGDAAR